MNLKIDSCSLILLQHLDLIPLIHRSYGKILITEAVYHEVIVQGQKKKKPEANKLDNYVKLGLIEKIVNRGNLPINLGLGEAETLAESNFEQSQGEGVLCITEDKRAKQEAIRLNLALLGVDSLLVELCLKGDISIEKFDNLIIHLDSYHKLSLIRITELRRFIYHLKKE